MSTRLSRTRTSIGTRGSGSGTGRTSSNGRGSGNGTGRGSNTSTGSSLDAFLAAIDNVRNGSGGSIRNTDNPNNLLSNPAQHDIYSMLGYMLGSNGGDASNFQDFILQLLQQNTTGNYVGGRDIQQQLYQILLDNLVKNEQRGYDKSVLDEQRNYDHVAHS